MHVMKISFSDHDNGRLDEFKTTLGTTKQNMIRHAISDFIVKTDNEARGLVIEWVRSRNIKQEKLDLD